MPSGPAVDCRDLSVTYGAVTAVDGVSFQVAPGEVLALLGPNGAGKTSTVETLEGYLAPTGGSVRVLGLDPRADHRALMPRIGVMLQKGGLYPTLGPARILRLFARYFDDPADPAALLADAGLAGVARTPFRRLSGGEQQRLSLALALVGRPEVLFLDEPTAGVDPEGRLAVRRLIGELRDRGVAVLLTTHELPEAAKLADRILIVDHGRVVAAGTLAELTAGEDPAVRFGAPPGLDRAGLATALGIDPASVTEPEPGRYRLADPGTPARLAALTAWLADRDLALADLQVGGRTLEEVYLAVTHTSGGEL